MEMNNDIFTPDLPIPEPVGFEDAPIPAPAEEEKPAEPEAPKAPTQEELLTEILAVLKEQQAANGK